MMGNVTKNFDRREWECECGCGMDDPHPALVMSWQQLGDLVEAKHAKRPYIAITGPGRCAKYNRSPKVLGAENSHHVPGVNGYYEAADGHIYFRIDTERTERLPLRKLYGYARTIAPFAQGGIGVYCDDAGPRIHADVRRTGPARWGVLYDEGAEIEDVLDAADEWEARERKENGR